ncbi:MAG TPA: YraN family protein [Acidimicrobiia bacterium]|nr:YraN family protein [Acidimicrobiia bacterium]
MSYRRRHIGQLGERVAVGFLQRHGVEVVARNVRVGAGEIDVLARDGDTRVAVEVRTVTGSEDPLGAFDTDKRAQVERLARRVGAYRVDFVAVRLGAGAAEVRWVRGAA